MFPRRRTSELLVDKTHSVCDLCRTETPHPGCYPGVARGDVGGVATFMRHQPLLSAVLAAPAVGVAVATRHPPLALSVARALFSPTLRFFAIMTGGFVMPTVHAVSSFFFDVDLTERVWRTMVSRAKARNERRRHLRLRKGDVTDDR